ncbi:hydrogenase maturation nickel metallochaperone HypA [Pseudonocardia kujensis]|uniref:hydrogenase maturation nickel metallochaperone HypA/HybF n=1 Tax=Pseudonocardia kujensis TaxID=1128675 RepID=UPI001E36DE16|nr:hydrogenase maturation nickel metallochaperone HypA [Pseudonocardia kujensis]MCE0766461.1 hydrogenase maturation nickel metallochaperone HypA [Pseudonocardia kujensis]
MHELGITQSVVDAVTDRLGPSPVRRVRLEIGRLSGVVPDAVRFCFELVTAGTTLEGAVLEIDEPEGEARCRTCGTAFATSEVLPLCACGSADVEVLGGASLRIREVELVAREGHPGDVRGAEVD